MRVMCFIDSLGSGGAQRQLAGLAVALKQRGHEVRFLVYHAANHFEPLLGKADIAAETVRPCSLYRRVCEVRRVLREGWQDVVLAFLEGPSLYAELAGLPSRKWGLVVGERLAFPALGSPRARLLRWFHRFADHIVTNSHTCGLMLAQYSPALRAKVRTIYNAIDLVLFAPGVETRGPARSGLRIVVAASYQANKNMLGVANALKLMRDRGADDELTVDWYGGPANDPAPLVQAKAFVHKHGLSSRLRFHEATRQIEAEYRSADAVGLFSFYEGLPNVVCEGMACGKPILMSDVCDAGNLVVDGENGFVCDPHSPESIAHAFQRFAALSPAARQRMGEASRRQAEDLFALGPILDRYERILAAAAARRPPPPDCAWPLAVPESARRTVALWSAGCEETG